MVTLCGLRHFPYKEQILTLRTQTFHFKQRFRCSEFLAKNRAKNYDQSVERKSIICKPTATPKTAIVTSQIIVLDECPIQIKRQMQNV
mmetsp:Transcript_46204/g.68145  ORF Transcript_46204/g.68145 Transcript_46204/m.68145 type:complete len:88 (+) Transcript_46204:415-678(+)